MTFITDCGLSSLSDDWANYKLREMCPNTEFFWSVFSFIRTQHRDFRRKSPYSIQMQENTNQKTLRIWTHFTQ